MFYSTTSRPGPNPFRLVARLPLVLGQHHPVMRRQSTHSGCGSLVRLLALILPILMLISRSIRNLVFLSVPRVQ